jgi:hypothetical protein
MQHTVQHRWTDPPRLYRAKTISELGIPLQDEIAWLNPTALKHLKNYQIWHHRHTIIDALGSPDGEAEFINNMLEQDSKNYHVWSYRQWLVKRFNLFDRPEELAWTAEMIEADVRNNSAWNHRYYLVVGGRNGKPNEDLAKRELEYATQDPGYDIVHYTDHPPGTLRKPFIRRRRIRARGTISLASFGLPSCPSRPSKTLRSNLPTWIDLMTFTPPMPLICSLTSTPRKMTAKRRPTRL